MSTPTLSSIRGTGYKNVNIPRLSPEQSQLFQQSFGALSPHLGSTIENIGQLAGGGTPEMWEQLEAPAMRQFNQLQGQLSSRFSGMGTGARRSSGFQNASSGAATDLAERLQGQRLGLQQGAQKQLMQLYQSLMNSQPYENILQEKKKNNPWGSAFEGAGTGALTGSVFGPWGTAAGALIGGTTGYFGGR